MYEHLQTIVSKKKLEPNSFQVGVLNCTIQFLEKGIDADIVGLPTDISEVTKAILEHMKNAKQIDTKIFENDKYSMIGLLSTYKDFLKRTSAFGPLSETQVNTANQLTQFFYCLATAQEIFRYHPVIHRPTMKEIILQQEDDE